MKLQYSITIRALLFFLILSIFFTGCEKKDSAPSASTQAASSVLMNTATLNGTVNANGFSTEVYFEYGTTTNYGRLEPAIQSPLTGNKNTNVSADLTFIKANTQYNFRVKASNAVGITYGSNMSFTTAGQAPTVTTLPPRGFIENGFYLQGTVNENGFSATVEFEYGTTISYGNTISANIVPPLPNTPETDIKVCQKSITGLTLGTTYHYRTKAVNSRGTSYGNDMEFIYLYYGAIYQGGLVFYHDGGLHGLVCAPSDKSSGIRWYNGSYLTTGAIALEIGTGQANTTKIVSIQGVGSYAAKLCDDLVLNGYSDWYLPSRFELWAMYENLKKRNLGNFPDAVIYWSSSESDKNTAIPIGFDFTGFNSYDKKTTDYVRAIRSF